MIRSTFLFIIAVVFGYTAVQSQTIPNGTFESWSDTIHATSWNNNNSTSAHYVRRSTSVHGGSWAALLVTTPIGSSGDLSGILTLGTINLSTQVVTRGKPLSGKPTEFHGYYKYTPGNASDKMSIALSITKWNSGTRQTLFSNTFTAGTAANYTLFSMPITYSPYTAIPDSFNIIVKSSATNVYRGSHLWVDDFAFTSNVGIEEPLEFSPQVMPNPANENLFVKLNGEEFEISIYNISGQRLLSERTNEKFVTLNISQIPQGVYIVNVIGDNYKYSSKVIINH